MVEKKRARRRRVAEAFVKRRVQRQKAEWRWCPHILVPGRFRKRSLDTHGGCAKRRRGRPRVGYGACYMGSGDRERVYRWRAEALELGRLLLRGEDALGDPVALLSYRVPTGS